jgi:hypothetical protein
MILDRVLTFNDKDAPWYENTSCFLNSCHIEREHVLVSSQGHAVAQPVALGETRFLTLMLIRGVEDDRIKESIRIRCAPKILVYVPLVLVDVILDKMVGACVHMRPENTATPGHIQDLRTGAHIESENIGKEVSILTTDGSKDGTHESVPRNSLPEIVYHHASNSL